MPDLGNARLTLTVAGDKFKSGLAQAKGQADKTTKGIGKSFSNLQGKIQGAAGKVPVVGSSLAALASPAGLAAAGIGLVVGGLTKMVGKTLDTGRRLGELREKLGVSAEAIQIYERAIEEGNGNTGAFERSTLRLQKTIGDAAGGNKKAAEQFELLGLSFEDVANKSPEEALRAVLGAANDTLEPTDRASVLAATLGRSYADMGGFATKGADELTAMLDGVKDVAVTMSGEGVTAVDQYDTANRDMRDSFGSIVTEVGMALIPTLTQLFGVIKQIMPLIKTAISIALLPLKNVIGGISAVVGIVSAVLKGDFTGALKIARDFFIDTASNILEVGAKIVGLFNKDMADSIRGVRDDLKELKTDAAEPAADQMRNDLAPAATDAAGEITTLGNKAATAAGKVAELTSTSRTGAEVVEALRVASLDAKSAIELMRLEVEASDGSMISANTTALTYLDTMTSMERVLEAWRITQLEARQEADLFALSLGRVARGYVNVAEAADNAPSPGGGGGGGGGGSPGDQDAEDAAARQAGIRLATTLSAWDAANPYPDDNDFPDTTAGYRQWWAAKNGWGSDRRAIISQYAGGYISPPGFSGTSYPSTYNPPAAQHGAAVSGSRYGSLVRVGENFTNENITPVGRNGGGSGRNQGGRREYPIYIGDEKLTTLVLNAQNELEDTGRA